MADRVGKSSSSSSSSSGSAPIVPCPVSPLSPFDEAMLLASADGSSGGVRASVDDLERSAELAAAIATRLETAALPDNLGWKATVSNAQSSSDIATERILALRDEVLMIEDWFRNTVKGVTAGKDAVERGAARVRELEERTRPSLLEYLAGGVLSWFGDSPQEKRDKEATKILADLKKDLDDAVTHIQPPGIKDRDGGSDSAPSYEDVVAAERARQDAERAAAAAEAARQAGHSSGSGRGGSGSSGIVMGDPPVNGLGTGSSTGGTGGTPGIDGSTVGVVPDPRLPRLPSHTLPGTPIGSGLGGVGSGTGGGPDSGFRIPAAPGYTPGTGSAADGHGAGMLAGGVAAGGAAGLASRLRGAGFTPTSSGGGSSAGGSSGGIGYGTGSGSGSSTGSGGAAGTGAGAGSAGAGSAGSGAGASAGSGAGRAGGRGGSPMMGGGGAGGSQEKKRPGGSGRYRAVKLPEDDWQIDTGPRRARAGNRRQLMEEHARMMAEREAEGFDDN